MIRTIRFRDLNTGIPSLGYLQGNDVYNLTQAVASWHNPVEVWMTLRALKLDAATVLNQVAQTLQSISFSTLVTDGLLLPPVASQEVWAAGVTYERSRQARNAETKLQDSVYDRVYDAKRPEIFFKSTYDRLVAPGHSVGLRSDSSWMVPEPELALVITKTGETIGWTLGNDVSSRDIEGENPLYLPQAKIFSRSCSIGPTLLWNTGNEQPASWTLQLTIYRNQQPVVENTISMRQLRRTTTELIAYLLCDNPVPNGTVLLTGTGIVPPDEFTLKPDDRIDITISEIGTLSNIVAAPLVNSVTPVVTAMSTN